MVKIAISGNGFGVFSDAIVGLAVPSQALSA